MRRSRRIRVGVLLVIAAAAVTGCSGDDDESGSRTEVRGQVEESSYPPSYTTGEPLLTRFGPSGGLGR